MEETLARSREGRYVKGVCGGIAGLSGWSSARARVALATIAVTAPCLLSMGCGEAQNDDSSARTFLSSGADEPSACRITILNPSEKEPHIAVSVPDDRILVDEKAPSRLNREPPVCGMLFAHIAGKTLSISIDGIKTQVEIDSSSKEIVVNVAKGATSIEQHTKRLVWQ